MIAYGKVAVKVARLPIARSLLLSVRHVQHNAPLNFSKAASKAHLQLLLNSLSAKAIPASQDQKFSSTAVLELLAQLKDRDLVGLSKSKLPTIKLLSRM